MTIKMLINAQRAQQLRVAIADGAILKDYQVEIADRRLCRGNIYRGVVANIQPSLNAAFIDIGEERHGFLPVGDVSPSSYHRKPEAGTRRPRIDQVLTKGKNIFVQVTKDGVGQKGSALTTNVALAGRYLVLTPFDSVRGISRKAEDDKERKKIRERLKKLTLPDDYGVIVRTNGLEQNQTTLNRDLNALLRLWKKIRAETAKGQGPRLLYSDQDLVVQALRDYLDSSVAEVIVDDQEVYKKVENYMRAFMPRSKTQLTFYQERLPLFSKYRLETQIDRIYERSAPLPGGGSLVIDGTEALTAIDVNSGRATHTNDHDESIFKVNVEAAAEVARQLRLRDIGGLVVVDFIDMRLRKHQNKVEKAMRDAMKVDKARYAVGRISTNGLLEINRQRIKQALRLRTHRPCPTCDGVGTIASPEFASLSLLGRVEARVATGLVDRVTIALHPEMADVLQNRHRARLAALEADLDLTIEIISAPAFSRMEERIEWHQREGGAISLAPLTSPALSATDITSTTGTKSGKRVDSDSEEAPRKRRRRRRKTTSRYQDKTSDEEKAESQTAADEENQESSSDQAAQDGAAEEKPARPRRRRRRKPAASASTDASTSAATAEGSSDEESAEKPKPRRRRSTAASAAKKATEEAKKADGEETEESEKPKRTRRRTTTTRRRKTSSKTAETDAETPKAASKSSRARRSSGETTQEGWNTRTEGPQDIPDDLGNKEQPKGDEKPSRSRAPRRRPSRSRTSKPAAKSKGAEGNGTGRGRSTRKKPAARQPAGRKPAGRQPTARQPADPMKQPKSNLSPGLAPSSSPPKRSGTSAQQLRWQWWGGSDDSSGGGKSDRSSKGKSASSGGDSSEG